MESKAVADYVHHKMIQTHVNIAMIFNSYSPSFVRPLCDANWRFNCYPFLFTETFPNVGQEAIREYSYIWRLGLEYMLITDSIFDMPKNVVPSDILWAQIYYDSLLRQLHNFFPSNSSFWHYYENYLQEYMQAILSETCKIRDLKATYSSEEFEHIYAGRSSFGKLAIAGLAIMDGSEQKIPPLASSHDYFSVALQFRDDLQDWLEDFNNSNYTYLIRYALFLKGISIDDFVKNRLTEEELKEIIYQSGATDWALDQSRAYLLRAYEAASSFNVPEWLGFFDYISESLDVLQHDIDDIK
jgi:hypothetical protein